MARKSSSKPAKKTAAKKPVRKNEHSVVVKNALLEDEQISSLQPIECVFSDMSQRLMRIMRDLLSPAFIFEKEQIQNTVTIFGSARIKSEEVAKAELDALKKHPAKTKEYKEKLDAAKRAVEMSKYYTAACELARPHAREAGDEDALGGIEWILKEGGGAERQRAAHGQGGAEELLDLLERETAARL